MVQSLIQRIRENKLDALYLFINESLRDRSQFDIFFHNLMVVLPNNWSINRVEIGHEFLSRTVVADQQQAGQADGNNNENDGSHNLKDSNGSKQDQLFRCVCSLESLRTLIVSDGYIPRKDHGFLNTKALLHNLPRANNLQRLEIQRLNLRLTGDGVENNYAELLAESLHSLRDSIEDLRLPAISLWGARTTTDKETKCEARDELPNNCNEEQPQRYPLDPLIRVCGEMTNLQLLAITCANCCESRSQNIAGNSNREGTIRDEEGERDCNNRGSSIELLCPKTCLISREVLLRFCRSSSTLQELALRRMNIDDDICRTIAKALNPEIIMAPSPPSLSLMCADSEEESSDQHSPSFWTSLDLRQNPSIGTAGYEAILSSLERNCDLWCSLMVDNDSFQARFNALIELNQANRGALVRSPTSEKLAVFLDRLKDDPTALWYFLTIHRDSILHPLTRFLKWKKSIDEKNGKNTETNRAIAVNCEQQQQGSGQKRTAEAAALPSQLQPTFENGVTSSIITHSGAPISEKVYQVEEAGNQNMQLNFKRPRQSAGEEKRS